MRINNIISSIANVIRFSVQGTSMLRSNDLLLEQRQRNFCYWPLSTRHCGTDLLFCNLSVATAGITGKPMPGSSERPSQKLLGSNSGLIQRLFLRLS